MGGPGEHAAPAATRGQAALRPAPRGVGRADPGRATHRLAQLLDQRQALPLQAALEAVERRESARGWLARPRCSVPAGAAGDARGLLRAGRQRPGSNPRAWAAGPPSCRARSPLAVCRVPATGARVKQLHQLIRLQVQQLVQVHPPVRELAEGARLLRLLGGVSLAGVTEVCQSSATGRRDGHGRVRAAHHAAKLLAERSQRVSAATSRVEVRTPGH